MVLFVRTEVAVKGKKIYRYVTSKAVFVQFEKAIVMHDGSSGGGGDSGSDARGGGGLGICSNGREAGPLIFSVRNCF